MAGSSSKNFRTVILQQRADQLRLRILHQADIDFEMDALVIQQYRAQARELGNRDLELHILGIEAQLHLVTGRTEDGLAILEEGVEHALAWDNRARWVDFKAALARVYSANGDYAAAQSIDAELRAALTPSVAMS